MPAASASIDLAGALDAAGRRSLRDLQVPERRVDLWPQRLLWAGDPNAVCYFAIQAPEGERGPWVGNGQSWRRWRFRYCKTKELGWWFRGQWPTLQQGDAYASINRFYWPTERKAKGPARRARYVVRLGATFVDCDCGRKGHLTANEAEEKLRELVARGVVPPPSLLQQSGRGLWGFWLLRDPNDSELSPKAFGEAGAVWSDLQRAVADRLVAHAPALRVDRRALDPVRVTRLHGSVHGTTGQEVVWKSFDPSGPIPRYTLDELAKLYQLDRATLIPGWSSRPEPGRDRELEAHRARQDGREAQASRVRREGVDPVASENGRKGHLVLWRDRRLGFLERLIQEDFGGRIPRGKRHSILLLYGYCWSKLGAKHEELEARLGRLARVRCDQPEDDRITDHEIRSMVQQVEVWRDSEKGGLIRNAKFARLAGLDPVLDQARIEELGLDLERRTLKGRKKTTARRRVVAFDLLRTRTAEDLPLPSVRELAAGLEGQGIATGRDTAHRLLREFREYEAANFKARLKNTRPVRYPRLR